jgi:hypothetical protein
MRAVMEKHFLWGISHEIYKNKWKW